MGMKHNNNDLIKLLKEAVQKDASDLHLTPESPPLFRMNGELVPVSEKKLTAKEIEDLVLHILSSEQKIFFKKKRSVDIACHFPETGRFRVNIYHQKGAVTAAFRRLSGKISSLNELGLPQSLHRLSDFRDGLVLITGPTGCGKSTTLATIIDEINQTRACNIITIEDPVEYLHQHKKSIVNQKELYTDIDSFSEALRFALREDPDVILVGEIRDLDTMRTAIMAAETGHLVFSTLHTRDAGSSINRILGVFPAVEQQHVRYQLSEALKAVVSQRLLKRIDAEGRIPAVEVMIVTRGISNLIRSGKTEQIYSSIETGVMYGMQTMEQSLLRLYKQGKIDKETVFKTAKNPRLIEKRML